MSKATEGSVIDKNRAIYSLKGESSKLTLDSTSLSVETRSKYKTSIRWN